MAKGKYQKKRKHGGMLFLIILLAVLLVAAILYFIKLGFGDDSETTKTPSNSTLSSSNPTETTAESSTVPSTEPTTVPTEPYIVSTASVGVTGDVLIHSPVFNAAYEGSGNYDFSEMFTYIADYYAKYDFMVANLEVTLSGPEREYSGYPQFNCPDSIVDALKDSGVDMLLNANNHTYDHGHHGLIRTQEVLDEKDMPHLGTRLSEDDPLYIVQDINGIQIGMVCYTYETGNTSDGRKTLNGIAVSHDDTELIGSFHPKHLDEFYAEVENTIDAMYADGADVTMVYIHWGEEYQLKQNNQQQTIAESLCELGVDVIVGGHPHVVQPFEVLTSESGHQTYCIYSVGNALSNQRRTAKGIPDDGTTEDGMIFGVTFQQWNDGTVEVCEIEILPTWVSKEWSNSKGNTYYILPLDSEKESWDGFAISSDSYKYLKGSYKRTMATVGEGLNPCREALGLQTMPLTADEFLN